MIPLVIVGGLEVPESNQAAWLAESLDPAQYQDWPEDTPLIRGESEGAFENVGELFSALESELEAPSFFELTQDGLQAFFTPDMAEDLSQDLATALRLAERHGGKGLVAFIAISEEVACALPIGEGTGLASPTWMPAGEALGPEVIALPFISVMDYVKALDSDPDLTRAEFLAERRGLGLLPLEEQPLHQELLKRLAALDAKALHAAMHEHEVSDIEGKPLSKTHDDAEALRQAIAAATPEVRAAAIELLSLVDPESTAKHALELLKDPSRQVRRHAVLALGRSPSDSDFQVLLDLDHGSLDADPLLQGILREAVEHSEAPNADEHVLERMRSHAKEEDWGKALRGSPERQALLRRAALALEHAAARLGYKVAPALENWFDKHPHEDFRRAVAQALLEANPDLTPKKEEAIQLALMGMGKGANQDEARRLEILELPRGDYSNGLMRFEEIDAGQLAQLVNEGFAHPDIAQNEAPPIGLFLDWMQRHPELKASGYLIPPTRPDYRVSLDTLTLGDLKGIPKERRQELEELFEALAET
ncbi:MAG: HEAT repeat domain-containing protein, partial [Myxococcales bacterium]|nr:HEAT repeat domain-containing protein [Myxococcales bacterium]